MAFAPALAAGVAGVLRSRSLLPRFGGLGIRGVPWFVVAWSLPFALALATLGLGLLSPGARFSRTIVRKIWTWVPSGDPTYEEEWEVMTPEGMATARVAEGADLERLLRTRPASPDDRGTNLEARPVVLTIRVSVGDQLVRSLWVGPTLGALVALGEEIGWRGYLLGELAPLGFWRSSLLVGLVWGLWHAPSILLGGRAPLTADPIADLLAQIALTILLSPLLSWIRIRSGTVLAAAILHGGVNAAAWLPLLFEPRDTRNGATMAVAGVVVLLAAWGAIARFDGPTVRGAGDAARGAPPGSQGPAP